MILSNPILFKEKEGPKVQGIQPVREESILHAAVYLYNFTSHGAMPAFQIVENIFIYLHFKYLCLRDIFISSEYRQMHMLLRYSLRSMVLISQTNEKGS